MSNRFKAAAIQMDCIPGDVAANLAAAERLVGEAARQGARLVALPELFSTGYRVEEDDARLSETIPGPTIQRMTALCRAHNIHIAGALIEETAKGCYDTAFVTGPGGLLGTYRKSALWGAENGRFLPGEAAFPVFDIGCCKLGLQICYEIGFPEGARLLALQGADVIVYPAAFGKARSYAWELASRARALENGCYVIACNRWGVEKSETEFAGNSRIVGPRGDLLASAAEDGDEAVVATLDLAQMRAQREAIPYLKDVYKFLPALQKNLS